MIYSIAFLIFTFAISCSIFKVFLCNYFKPKESSLVAIALAIMVTFNTWYIFFEYGSIP